MISSDSNSNSLYITTNNAESQFLMWKTQIAKIEDEVTLLPKSLAKSPWVSRKSIFPYKCNTSVPAVQAAQWFCPSQGMNSTLVMRSSSLLQGGAQYNSPLWGPWISWQLLPWCWNLPQDRSICSLTPGLPHTTSWSSLNTSRTSALPTYTCTVAQHYLTTLLAPNRGAPARSWVQPWPLILQWKKMGL